MSQASVASSIFLVSLVITFAVVAASAIRRSPRPPRILLGAGIGGLALAGVYVSLYAMLPTADHVGLWSPGLASVPTVLVGFGATATSVWVAIWTADRARISSFVTSEAALMDELRGVLLALQRQMGNSRQMWLGPQAVAVACGEAIMEKFRLLEPNPETGSTHLFGDGSIAEYEVEHELRATLERATRDLPTSLETARLMRVLEIRTGLPMDEILADVAFTSFLIGATEGRFPDAVRSTVDLQFMAVVAACMEGPRSISVGVEANSGSDADKSGVAIRHGWSENFKERTQRPERLQRELRNMLGNSPPTAFEALRPFPTAYLDWIERRWIGFVLAPDIRAKLVEVIIESNPEAKPPPSFSALSHPALWQAVAVKAGLLER